MILCPCRKSLELNAVALVVALQSRRRPVVDAHAERQTVALQNFLDLGQRLLAQIGRAQQFNLGALHEIADVMNVLGLEAVRAAHRELQLIDRTQQNRIELRFGGLGGRLVLALQVDEYRELILQDSAGAANRLFRVDGAVGFDIENELVQVGALLDARALDVVRDLAHRAERGVQLQTADGARLFFEGHALRRRAIPTAALDFQRHRQFAGFRQIRDHEIRIQNLDIVVAGNIAGRHRARALLVQAHLRDVAGVHADGHRFEVQQNVDDILLDTLDGSVLVEHTFDFDFSDGGARQRGQQYAAQGIAQRVTEAEFERFDHETRMARRHGLYFDDPRLQKLIDRSLHGYHLR